MSHFIFNQEYWPVFTAAVHELGNLFLFKIHTKSQFLRCSSICMQKRKKTGKKSYSSLHSILILLHDSESRFDMYVKVNIQSNLRAATTNML